MAAAVSHGHAVLRSVGSAKAPGVAAGRQMLLLSIRAHQTGKGQELPTPRGKLAAQAKSNTKSAAAKMREMQKWTGKCAAA